MEKELTQNVEIKDIPRYGLKVTPYEGELPKISKYVGGMSY